MRVLGYIVSKRKVQGKGRFVRVVESIDDARRDLPVLVIGWSVAKQMDGYKSIIDKDLSENVSWTFSEGEGRSRMEEDVLRFSKMCVEKFVSTVSYHYVNIFRLCFSSAKSLIGKLKTNGRKTIYISGDGMCYICCGSDVFGISLTMLSYAGIDRDRFIGRISAMQSTRVFTDEDVKVKSLSCELGNKRYAVPCLI